MKLFTKVASKEDFPKLKQIELYRGRADNRDLKTQEACPICRQTKKPLHQDTEDSAFSFRLL